MALVATGYEHIAIDESGVPIIANTTMKVAELLSERTAYGWSPEELHFQHPHLTLGQIYSALAYYWDHVEEVKTPNAACTMSNRCAKRPDHRGWWHD